jgi:hypothetical protein
MGAGAGERHTRGRRATRIEPRGDAVSERTAALSSACSLLALPFVAQELDDRLAALEEPVAVAPIGVNGVALRDLLGIARVPGVLAFSTFSRAVASVKEAAVVSARAGR